MGPADRGGFPHTARFQLVQRLGSGGMGVVFEALDRERDALVALKTLRQPDPSAIYRFKKEFRTLAHIAHPNLVALYELFGEGAQWYFTMELVRGGEFLEYVCPGALDVPRLRATLAQLTAGLAAIHHAGKLHRDLKPSNVRVTPEGRVVILDFGISADVIRGDEALRTREDGVWGTAEYMAPEQADGQLTPASDWYAVGCMLYEALTGRLPYVGAAIEILVDKRLTDPAPPETTAPDLPPDLARLCLDLLARAPERRPDAAEVLRRLGVTRSSSLSPPPVAAPPTTRFVGRHSELAELAQAFATARAGRPATVYVHGPSGIGKSALVRRFLEDVVATGDGIVLTGRCYARETVPYKGLDGVVDSLTRFLRTLPEPELDRLLSPELRSAVQLFPVLGRVEQLARHPTLPEDVSDPVQLRRQRFAALRELFARLRATRPIILHIDDLQWGDADSLVLLDFLFGPPNPLPLLLIATFPSEDLSAHPFLPTLLARVDRPQYRAIRVDRLTDEETRRLAHVHLPDAPGAAPADVEAIVRESAGDPFLVEQLAHYARSARHDRLPVADRITLPQVLEARLAQLPSGAAALLETLAIAARPVDGVVAREAAGLVGDERPLVTRLEAERWLRVTTAPERLELYHDRIRRAVAARIDGKRLPQLHRALGNAIAARRMDDPEALYEHFSEAGELERARSCAAQAGHKAALALAFERAALFYRRALDLTPAASPDTGRLRARLGDALANAGRVRDAAEAYAAAATLADPAEALELRRLAAEQLLIGGRIDEGLATLRSVLAAAGLKLARTPRQALLWLVARRLWLRVRGLRFVTRPSNLIPRAELARIDVCRTVAEGLAHLDTIRATDFQTRHLLLSLAAGEPDRIARALALEAAFAALGGSARGRRRSERLLAAATALAERVGSVHARGLCAVIRGTTAYFRGQFEAARTAIRQAEQLLLEHGVGVSWELVTTRLYHALSLFYLGDLPELRRTTEAYLRDAAERGNRFAGVMFRTGSANVTWLVADDVAGARRALAEALADWPVAPFGTPHYFAMSAEARIQLYTGQAQAAWQRLTESWPRLERTHLERIQAVRIVSRHLRASCAVAASRVWPEERTPLLRVAAHEIHRIERERAAWGTAQAELLRAAVTSGQDTATTVAHLRTALAGFEHCAMQLFAAVTRRRLGEQLGGDEGGALVARANAWMAAQDVRDPTRLAAMLAPGFAEA